MKPCILVSVLVLTAGLLLVTGCREATEAVVADVFTVSRGDLDITVAENGHLEAAESLSVKSMVSKTTRIIEIVEEGTHITEADIKGERVLVRLDAREFEDQLYQHESTFESAKASLTEAEEGLEIQKSENQSSIRSAELGLTFAVNDLRKLVGEELADAYADTAPEDTAALLEHPGFGGQALQDLRKLQSDIELEREELERAQSKLKWTEKLFAKGYVTANERDADVLALRRKELSLGTAESKLDIFRRYEFVKDFQKTWSTVLEAREKLDRAKAVARSKMAQERAKLNSRQGGFHRAKEQLDRAKEDIENCTIKATKPGLVVYKMPHRWRNEGPIQNGAEIRSKQTILELPDLSRIIVKVNIHEAQIDLVAPDQSVVVKIDAIPGKVFSGVVKKKALLPSAQNRWLNPDLKVYETRIEIDDTTVPLRPGMTANTEILIEHLESILSVPIQSVQTDESGKHFCYTSAGTRVPVTTGKRNRVFVEITEGLKEGDQILMSPPELKAGSE